MTSWSTSGSSRTESLRSLRRRSSMRPLFDPCRVVAQPTSSAAPSPAAAAKRSSSGPLGSATVTSLAPSSSRSRRQTRSSSRSRSVSVARALPISFSDSSCARPPRCCLVEPGVLDRDGRLTGQQRHELLVLFGEGLAAGLLGQVEVAVGHAAEQDRHAEERAHRRVTGRESDRARILGEVVQAQRVRLVDQRAEDPATAGEIADRRARRQDRCRWSGSARAASRSGR